MKRQILLWTLIGLMVRFLIMPFSFHGHDIFFIYYAPFKFINEGAWNPYLFLHENFPRTHNPYYPPAIFLVISAFLFLFKPLLPKLGGLFGVFESWNFAWEGNTVHYAKLFADHQLFRTLFLFKTPYLIFDFAAAWLLFRILRGDEKKGLLGYKLWMLNPFVLHGCYALGQVDIVKAFFLLGTVYLIYLNRRYLAMGMLSVGIMTKIFPVILLPFAVILGGRGLKERLKLSLAVAVPIAFVASPFYISSPAVFTQALLFSPSGIALFRKVLFIAGYLVVLAVFFFVKMERMDLENVVLIFILPLLLFYSLYVVTIRYFIGITPLLIYAALKESRLWVYNIIFVITLFWLRTAGNTQQWGLFAALHPEFFSGLPILDSYLNLAVNVKYIHQFMYRLFFASSLVMAGHILFILTKRGVFKFSLAAPKR